MHRSTAQIDSSSEIRSIDHVGQLHAQAFAGGVELPRLGNQTVSEFRVNAPVARLVGISQSSIVGPAVWLIPLTQVALDVVCREVGRVRSPGRTHDGQGALAFRIPEGIF